MNILIVGRGRVGSGLRRALRASGLHEVRSAGRNVQPSRVREADTILLAVSDDAIEPVAESVSPHLRPGAAVLHCAGARGTDLLAACEARGAAVGVMHPLVSFPSARRSPSLRGTTFTLQGSARALTVGRQVARACGARALIAQTGAPGYHAAAALVANGAAALAFVSAGVLERLGFEKRDAERAIGGLLKSVGDNVQELGVPAALTGPIARGEVGTVEAHRRAIRRFGRDALSTYDAMVPVVVRCARAAGLTPKIAAKILRETKP